MKNILNNIRKKRTIWIYRKKISSAISSNKTISNFKLNENQIKLINQFWGKYSIKPKNDWHRAYTSLNGIFDPAYIPEDIFYSKIIPKLGLLELSKAYADKNMYDKLFPEANKPKTLLRNIHGKYYDNNYLNLSYKDAVDLLQNNEGIYIIKPSIYSMQGRGVKKIEVRSNKILFDNNKITLDEIQELYNSDFIIQEVVAQSEILNNIYPHSLNTFRIMTIRLDDKIEVVSTVLRLGNNGLNVDNYSIGGVAVGVDRRGKLNDFGVDINFNKYDSHPYTKVSFKNLEIPNFNLALNLVKNLHTKLLYFNLASWDIAMDHNGNFVFIEVNLGGQELNFHQMNNGPLFGEKTLEILKKYKI